MVAIFQVLFLGCSSLRICDDLSAPCCTSACSKSGSGETLRHTKPTKVRQQRPLVALNISILLQFSRVQLFVTPWTAAHQASLSITSSRRLLKLMSTELVMPSNHLIFSWTLLFPPSIFPSMRVFANESVLCIRWPEYWSFSFSISSFNEYSGLFSFRIDYFDLLPIQGTLKSLFQLRRLKSSVSFFFFCRYSMIILKCMWEGK